MLDSSSAMDRMSKMAIRYRVESLLAGKLCVYFNFMGCILWVMRKFFDIIAINFAIELNALSLYYHILL